MVSLKRIGIFGGTFDPPHLAHLIIAEHAREQLKLDKVIFIPARIPPHKIGRRTTKAEDRMWMTELAVVGNPFFSVSDIEVSRQGVSYTLDTLKALKTIYPKSQFYLLLGSDNYASFHTWHKPNVIRQLSSIAVYRRGDAVGRVAGVTLLQGPLIDLSSSLIRRRVRKGLSIRYMVPASVEAYIRLHRLYR
ncbi:MAG TPA: nicotinate-nucleotide adenylyltransferase [Bacteroidota bacterium]|nr:nicotinate-nucleotide adenylyltransferase [Bacteroidota bacterium]